MPKYEYACKTCGERIEVTQSFADAPLTECPACAGVLRKVFSPPSIAFKGSGFYRTDNRKRRPNEPKTETKAESSSDAKADTKADTKVDTSSSSDSSGGTKAEPAKKEAAASTETKPKAAEAKTA